MNFGRIDNPEQIDFTLAKTHPETVRILATFKKTDKPSFFVGCASWNKANLKGFYPKRTKDELEYYAKQFNSIELNATFYRNFDAQQFEKWKAKTPSTFKFFPKLGQEISHFKRLNGLEEVVNSYINNFSTLQEKLGTIFLQLPANFSPKNFDFLQNFVENWPKDLPLAIEVRHKDWFEDATVFKNFAHLLEENNIANVLVDAAGRRDMMHMRLTNNEVFIRFVGANHPVDYDRLDSWVQKLKEWQAAGLQNIHFFIHQNLQEEVPLLATYFIKEINSEFGLALKIPNKNNDTTPDVQMSLF
ncbi:MULTISPECIES: DUF72 domain-containing protein [unclassified Polaribacter]|uniref:DUF72 domain-containing protein n=1 Tax=unclassified Polaribacter TaxID=196858 RepID=UPI0011BEBC67|nr:MULTISPECIES: DUF72 domain-containing protein [unclassified Polaribacter]TXD51770.1 DUF72 domain-containing protein [Polaribacter sp. IC063]TXD58981.1 DUF72 domain-containing protein [Polaribacter sp. IC066]